MVQLNARGICLERVLHFVNKIINNRSTVQLYGVLKVENNHLMRWQQSIRHSAFSSMGTSMHITNNKRWKC